MTRKQRIIVFTHLPQILFSSALGRAWSSCYNLHHVFAFEHWYLFSASCNDSAGQDKPQGRHPLTDLKENLKTVQCFLAHLSGVPSARIQAAVTPLCFMTAHHLVAVMAQIHEDMNTSVLAQAA